MDFHNSMSRFFLDDKQENIDRNKLEDLREVLKSFQTSDLSTLNDHKEYLLLLRKFREAVAKNNELNGANFNKTIAGLLAVGADGLYTKELRFIFELIQNVDDCDYKDLSDCNLSIQFDYNHGIIVLEYNEIGFRPIDVFSITGIAEASKNISPEKIEIGEKGIGFKSVFGVADKVLVQSGNFSFSLSQDNFTIPHEEYSSFDGINGTRLTLYLKSKDEDGKDEHSTMLARCAFCKSIFTKLIDTYSKKNSLFTQNPILFLNKLTKIKVFFDSIDSIEFSVEKNNPGEMVDNVYVEHGVTISSTISRRSIYPKKLITSISCSRYTKSIEYSHADCVSRYGKDTAFPFKKMNLQVIVPDEECLQDVGAGNLYSFLPTQVKTTVPMSCNIPFKLDGSRENVDHQGHNMWFRHSCDVFSELLCSVYKDIAKRYKENVARYLTPDRQFFFDVNTNNDKTDCFRIEEFSGSTFNSLPIFYCDGIFKSNKDVFSFSSNEEIENPTLVSSLLKQRESLFIAPKGVNAFAFGIKIYKDAYLNVFKCAIADKTVTADALSLLDSIETIKYDELLAKAEISEIDCEIIPELLRHTRCVNAFNSISEKCIKSKKVLPITIKGDLKKHDIRYIISEDEEIESSELDENVARYFSNRHYSYSLLDYDNERQYFIGNNTLVLCKKSPLESFTYFCRNASEKDNFSFVLASKNASIKLNEAELDPNVSNADYFALLRAKRRELYNCLGKKQYDSYISVINKCGTDPNRFLFELLQNVDDCKYAEGVKPCFTLTSSGNTLVAEHNEIGFTKSNVRAITAIGDSTKKQLRDGKEIGEKGIGFKSVFGVASSVEIYSNQFNFKLTSEKPTIPELITSASPISGTKMVFSLRNKLDINSVSAGNILSMCLCLRNIQELTINSTKVTIQDIDHNRIISINGKDYKFFRYPISIQISDKEALAERCSGGKDISDKQEIVFYVPEQNMTGIRGLLYCGLPTTVELGIPLCVDAPFELTSARDHVLENRWNSIIRSELYVGYCKLLESLCYYYEINVLKYIRFESLNYGKDIRFALFKNQEWLNSCNVLGTLRNTKFIPTYEKGLFVSPSDSFAYRYPSVVHLMFDYNSDILDGRKIIKNPHNEEYDAALKNLGCRQASTREVVELISKEAVYQIEEDKFRDRLYKYLSEAEDINQFSTTLRNAMIIPVKSKFKNTSPMYIAWNMNEIYIDESVSVSSDSYCVLDTGKLSKSLLEKVLGVNIIVLDERYKKSLYEERLIKYFEDCDTPQELFANLFAEYTKNRQMLSNSRGILLQHKFEIPFLVEDGSYHIGNVFYSDNDAGYYQGKLFTSRLINAKYKSFALFLDVPCITTVQYDNLEISEQLSEDDVMDLTNDTISSGYAILMRCAFEGFISQQLIEAYNIPVIGARPDTIPESDFPSEKVDGRIKISNTPRSIISEEETRMVQKIVLPNGNKQLLSNSDARAESMDRYRPDNNSKYCFCQMCEKVKPTQYIEVNNLISKPTYYWPQLRVCLCLECSKKFEDIKRNEKVMNKFYGRIVSASTSSYLPISIDLIEHDTAIKFTQKHLAEIQEILKTNKL